MSDTTATAATPPEDRVDATRPAPSRETLRERVAASIRDAYYSARDHGGTMHTASWDAADAVLAVLDKDGAA